jgi:hypothetical protein
VRKTLAIAIIAFSLAGATFGQRFTYPSELARAFDSLGERRSPGLYRPVVVENPSRLASLGHEGGLILGLLPASSFTSYNTEFPQGDDDGALWQGRGASGILRAGLQASWDWGYARLYPEWWFAQNLDYSRAPNAGQPTIEDYGVGLDRLQAYGTRVYQNLSLGQSQLRLRRYGFTLGFGTENVRFGPAEIQNVLMSDNAAGFPKIDLGTDGPLVTPFGAIEARFFWGQTTKTKWFDSDRSTDERLMVGGLLSYSPPFLDNMSFGFQRLFHSPWKTADAWKVFQFFDDTVWKKYRGKYSGLGGAEDDVDQVLSFTWEWRLPETGSRAYVEWARNDHANDITDFLMQPEHSDGYVLGLQQKIEVSAATRILFSFEMADVGNNIGTIIRRTGSWYRQRVGGYTNDGQVMGAPMGPGSNSQELNVYLQRDNWFVGLGAQRMVYDADYFYTIYTADGDYLKYNIFGIVTVRAGLSLRGAEIGLALVYAKNWNRNFIAFSNSSNWHAELGVKHAF